MSGGSLDYFYCRFEETLERISTEIKWGKNKWSNKTLKEFQKAIGYLKQAQLYSQRIEWLLSGDDGEESFHKRLAEELEELKQNSEKIKPQVQKCPLCNNFNGKECKNRWNMQSFYYDHPKWEQMDRESYKKRMSDASDCWNFEEKGTVDVLD